MDRLRKRPDFLKAAKGKRWATPSVVVQARRRRDGDATRVGFTVTRKVGNAVIRNRVKRRLKEAARQMIVSKGNAGFDYVLIGRRGTLTRAFSGILEDLSLALDKVHGQYQRSRNHVPDTASRDVCG